MPCSPAKWSRREHKFQTLLFSLIHVSKLACAASQGFAILDPRNKSIQYLSKPLPAECVGRVRFNDGACDSKGRFFAGTICSREHNIPGRLYCYDPSEGTTTLVDEGPFTVRSTYRGISNSHL